MSFLITGIIIIIVIYFISALFEESPVILPIVNKETTSERGLQLIEEANHRKYIGKQLPIWTKTGEKLVPMGNSAFEYCEHLNQVWLWSDGFYDRDKAEIVIKGRNYIVVYDGTWLPKP